MIFVLKKPISNVHFGITVRLEFLIIALVLIEDEEEHKVQREENPTNIVYKTFKTI